MNTIEQAHLKQYLIYNDGNVTFIHKDSLEAAKTHAINYCNHSHEIIVREVNNIRNLNK